MSMRPFMLGCLVCHIFADSAWVLFSIPIVFIRSCTNEDLSLDCGELYRLMSRLHCEMRARKGFVIRAGERVHTEGDR